MANSSFSKSFIDQSALQQINSQKGSVSGIAELDGLSKLPEIRHGQYSNPLLHALASSVSAGFMSSSDFVKLSNLFGIPVGGNAGQSLIKNTSGNYDVSWGNPTITGTSGTFAGFAPSGNIYEIPGWKIGEFLGASIYQTIDIPIDGVSPQFKRIHSFESEINPENVSSLFNLSSFSIDLHVDRTGSNNDFDGQVKTFSSVTTLEGNSHVESVIAQEISLGLGIGSNTGSNQSARGLFIPCSVQNGFNANELVPLDVGVNVATSGGINYVKMLNMAFTGNVSGAFEGIIADQTGNVGSSLTKIRMNRTGNIVQDYSALILGVFGNVSGNYNGSQLSLNGNTTNFNGLSISHTGNASNSSTGLSVNMQSSVVTNGLPTGLNVNGGSISTNVQSYLPNAFPAATLNSFITQVGIQSGSPISGTFAFANNFSVLSQFDDDVGDDGTGLKLGIIGTNAGGLMSIASGKTVDSYTGILVGYGVPATSSGGTLSYGTMFRAAGFVPQGGTLSVDELYAFKVENIFSSFAVSGAWGLFVDDANAENYIAKSLVVGGSTKKVSNSDVAIEIASEKVMRLSSLTTTERDALSALPGMIIFNETTDQFEGRTSSSWVGL